MANWPLYKDVFGHDLGQAQLGIYSRYRPLQTATVAQSLVSMENAHHQKVVIAATLSGLPWVAYRWRLLKNRSALANS
jgi:hypothetical protein